MVKSKMTLVVFFAMFVFACSSPCSCPRGDYLDPVYVKEKRDHEMEEIIWTTRGMWLAEGFFKHLDYMLTVGEVRQLKKALDK